MTAKKVVSNALLALLASSALLAQDIPLNNWTVPPYNRASASGGMTTMTDISDGVTFVAIQPCRIADTRGGGVFVGTYGPPAIPPATQRDFDINSAPHCTGIPAGVEAYSLNFTVTQTAGGPGDLRAWPTGSPPPPSALVSILNWSAPNTTIANATIVPAGTGGSITVEVAGAATHLLIDINGYFTDDFNTGTQGIVAVGTVNDTVIIVPPGIPVEFPGIMGFIQNNSTTFAIGIHGQSLGTEEGSAGVRGVASATTAVEVYGVYGSSNSTGQDSAGVIGIADIRPNLLNVGYGKAGVRGESISAWGVFGVSESTGVAGFLSEDGTGNTLASGRLGTNFGNDPSCAGIPPCPPPWAVFGSGDIGATGTKHFVDPHPKDASLVIKYASLEGPEVGTYFRGRGKFLRGLAAIDVPEDFRFVTAEEGLSIQVTPIGDMATVAVAQIGLERIVIKGSRDVEFFYTVNGVRRGYEGMKVVSRDFMFVPEAADAPMPGWLNENQKRSLIQNGTYRPDGRVNPETAQRLGWDKIWAERERPVAEPAPE